LPTKMLTEEPEGTNAESGSGSGANNSSTLILRTGKIPPLVGISRTST
jgi:hypothetical protein